MSTRQMGQYYRAQSGGGLSTMPRESLDLFGIQERRRGREAEHQLDIQKRLAEFMANLEKDLRKDEGVRKAAAAKGVSDEEYAKQIMPGVIQNAIKSDRNLAQVLDMDYAAQQTDDAKKSRQIGINFANVGLSPNTPQKIDKGSAGLLNIVPGGNQAQAFGGGEITRMTEGEGKEFKDKSGNVIYREPGKPVLERTDTPGRILMPQQMSPISTVPPPQVNPFLQNIINRNTPALATGAMPAGGAQSILDTMPSPNQGSPVLSGYKGNQQDTTNSITTMPPNNGAPMSNGLMDLLRMLFRGNPNQGNQGIPLGY